MSLPELFRKIKDLVADFPDISKEVFIVVAIMLTGVGAFMLGRISLTEEVRSRELKILSTETDSIPRALVAPKTEREEEHVSQRVSTVVTGMYVGSRNGSVYHLPTCPGAKQIREENKIWFSGKADANAKGYKPAANCKGI